MDIRLDEVFLFGMGVFETIAVEQGRPLLLEQHLNRMQGSADFLKLGSCAERGLTKEKIAEFGSLLGSQISSNDLDHFNNEN